MTPEELISVLRRRLRRLRAVSMLSYWGWVPALCGLTLVVLARHVSWPATEAVALATIAVGVAVVGMLGWFRRYSDLDVARIADRGLSTHDALTANLEFGRDSHGFAAEDGGQVLSSRISARAAVVASQADKRQAARFPKLPRPQLAAGVVLVLLAVGLTNMSNPQDAARDRTRRIESAQKHSAEELRRAADALDPDSEAARRLDAAAKRLEAMAPEQALALLRSTEAQLAETAGQGLESAGAASEGLDASLQARPLPGGGVGDAVSQLKAAAAGFDGLDPAQRTELAQRLRGLAATQSAGAPDVAETLSQAASAVDSGQGSAAATALNAAAKAQLAQQASVATRGDASAAADAVGGARASLSEAMRPATGNSPGRSVAQSNTPSSAPRQGQGQGIGQGQGQGTGQGQGQGTGQGQGQGKGTGQGQGQGQGQGAGGASGNVAGGQRTGSGQGQGAAGQPGAGSGKSRGSQENNDPSDPNSSVFAPDPSARASGEGPATASGGDLGQNFGKGDTRTELGSARTSLAQAIRRYSAGATRAAQRPGMPSVQRDLINSYFARLSASS